MANIHDLGSADVAIIGLDCRFPGAASPGAFWWNLREGVETIAEFSPEEIVSSGVDPMNLSHPDYVRAAAVLEDAEMFDAEFFGIANRDAELMDPQHRVLLECAWHALENAGYDPQRCPLSIGIFAGARTDTYLFNIYARPDLVAAVGAFEVGLGNDLSFLSARISHKLGLKGPSYSIQTACSTSLAAVHLACRSLLMRECQIALAGAVAINFPQKMGYIYKRGGILSPDGHCRAFDEKAQGTVLGSGAGMVVLKRALDAVADDDSIYAIIKGSALNSDGSVKASFTAPSVNGQAEVISAALANAGVGPESISYVEAHGTGTNLGDPIEIRALTKAFDSGSQRKGYCGIGSVKTNIGHLDAAAGIAGLIKTVLALHHKMIPPSLHFKIPNPHIDFANSPFYVTDRLQEWEAKKGRRRAGVSAFGIGGTNVHVVLEEAPLMQPPGPSRSWQLLCLSARSAAALETQSRGLVRYLRQNSDTSIADAAFTLATGRARFAHRRISLCRDVQDAIRVLDDNDSTRSMLRLCEHTDRPVVFLFPGQGTQLVNIGRQLYDEEPLFRECLLQCAEVLQTDTETSLIEILYPTQGKEAEAAEQMKQTRLSQPVVFALEYAFARLWSSYGVHPAAMLGHSIGEYVAACIAGVFSAEEGMKLVVARGQLMQEAGPGAMTAVALSEERASSLAGKELSLAAVNGPSQCVLAGTVSAVQHLEKRLTEQGVNFRRLAIPHAFHSHLMDGILDAFGAVLSGVHLKPPKVRYLSNVTGNWIEEAKATDSQYWVSHLREPVRFYDALQTAILEYRPVLVEVGPGQTLGRLCRALPKSLQNTVVSSTGGPGASEGEQAVLLRGLGELWAEGVAVDWKSLYQNEQRRRIALPTYPFERQRFWIEPDKRSMGDADEPARTAPAQKTCEVSNWFYVPSWKMDLRDRGPAIAANVTWLVILDEFDFGAHVCRQLESQGHRMVRVSDSPFFQKETQSSYKMPLGHRSSYARLLDELKRDGNFPARILHFSSLVGLGPLSDEKSFRQVQRVGYYSLVHLSQALSRPPETQVDITVITSGLAQILGNEDVLPETATILAPCTVIPQENQNLSLRCIDIETAYADLAQRSRICDSLMVEISAPAADKIVALRGRSRWIRKYEPIRLAESPELRSKLRARGTYLITGGLGSVGMVLSNYLAETVQANLVLVSRRALPKCDEWKECLSSDHSEPETQKAISHILGLEALGSEVLAVAADVGDVKQMQLLIDQVEQRFGVLHGVIHAAGITRGFSALRPFGECGEAEAETQFQPKAYGTYSLHRALGDRKLDFCMLMSSTSSILGGLGHLPYAAANLFMDSFARKVGLTDDGWISVNWDPWPQPSKPGPEYQTTLDVYKMTREESIQAFDLVLRGARASQVIVATGDFPKRLQMWTDGFRETHTSKYDRPDLPTPYVPPENDVQRRLASLWAELLGVDKVGIHDNFFDLGGHSLLALRLMGRVREEFHLDLSVAKLFEEATIANLAGLISLTLAASEGPANPDLVRVLEQIPE